MSEALNRMARRMKKRYPEQARVLERASVDICFEFYKSMSEAQKKALERMKEKQNLEIASQIEGRLRRAREEMQAGATAVSNAIHSTSSTQTVSASGEMGC